MTTTASAQAAQLPFDGVSLKIGRRDFICPPLCLRDVKRLLPRLALVTGDPVEQMEAFVDVIHAALTRNYPDLTRDEVEGLLDFTNIHAVAEAVLRGSGVEKKSQETQPEPTPAL